MRIAHGAMSLCRRHVFLLSGNSLLPCTKIRAPTCSACITTARVSAHSSTAWQGGEAPAAAGSRSLVGHHARHKHSQHFARLPIGCFIWPQGNGIGGGTRTDICTGVLAQQMSALQQRQDVDHGPVRVAQCVRVACAESTVLLALCHRGLQVIEQIGRHGARARRVVARAAAPNTRTSC